eukprot:CAMPEP_0113668740 /NCGR_PEP_ID=MMETSP0038_2-20120614/4168_1 /TAXON_ID=2898 /ORGANISM="Cryptomonas paramecium" /LENGTH=123 /DNA_ID=CAMNT_0000584517 /DNA_START=50 /DNA_END=421 /DNA_ORIENTATION=+ /assembly_acc=CAM_ASM_000170
MVKQIPSANDEKRCSVGELKSCMTFKAVMRRPSPLKIPNNNRVKDLPSTIDVADFSDVSSTNDVWGDYSNRSIESGWSSFSPSTPNQFLSSWDAFFETSTTNPLESVPWEADSPRATAYDPWP